jgi:dipeptidyl-peptidase-4
LDETDVKTFTVVDHRSYRGKFEVTAYPKSGDPIPKARVGWIDISSASQHWLDDAEAARQQLIVRVSWAPDSRSIITQVQDRRQTQLDLRRWKISGSTSHRILLETSPAWVEVLGEPIWLRDQSFLWLSHRSGYRHLYRVATDGSTVQVTSGEWEIRSVLGIDPKQEWVFFHAAKEDAIRRHAYRVRIAGGPVQQVTSSSWNHTSRPSASKDFFVDYYSSIHQPPAARLCRGDGTVVRMLQANLDDRLKHYAINPPKFLRVPARDGHLLDAMLIKPPHFDPDKKYPVIVYVYGGPQAPVVQDRWGGSTYLWHQYLAQQGFIIWMCDNRSSSYRSIRDAYPIHRNLGENELRDITDGLQWLKSHSWVDSSRIGIWGWSYGGYMTSYALTHSRLFRAGIAGAPVTDWRNYDAVYTERYMDLPQTNPVGYQNSSVVTAAGQLHGKLLVVHGTIDDNVHLSNTLQLVEALQKSGKDFEMMLYPGNRHNVANAAQIRHLRGRMTRFFMNELAGEAVEDN